MKSYYINTVGCWIFIWILMINYNENFNYKGVYALIHPDDGNRCFYLKVEKMLKARCHNINLREVPQYLSSDIKIFDLSFNRIKKLKTSSFRKYCDVKYLLLYDNMIQVVENGTFSCLTTLEEVDLSSNALITIPLELFNLPSLRNLYMDSNELSRLHEDLKNLVLPIKAPLEYFNVADCGLSDIPNLGILPNLWHFNASLNPLNLIVPQKFSYMCNLKTVDLDKTHVPYCSCQLIMLYFKIKEIKSNKNFCDVTVRNTNEMKCEDTSNITKFDDFYKSCSPVTKKTKIHITWLALALSFAVGFIILLFLVFIINCIKLRLIEKQNRRDHKPNFSPLKSLPPEAVFQIINTNYSSESDSNAPNVLSKVLS